MNFVLQKMPHIWLTANITQSLIYPLPPFAFIGNISKMQPFSLSRLTSPNMDYFLHLQTLVIRKSVDAHGSKSFQKQSDKMWMWNSCMLEFLQFTEFAYCTLWHNFTRSLLTLLTHVTRYMTNIGLPKLTRISLYSGKCTFRCLKNSIFNSIQWKEFR
jgi:hypothetical protein